MAVRPSALDKPLPSRLQAVLFDWDGTLVDSAEATFSCYQQLFGSYGISFDCELFARSYSPDWYQTYRAVGLSEELWGEADARWLALYAGHAVAPLAGAYDALARLAGAGLRLGIVSSGDRRRVGKEASALGLERFFSALVCAGEAARPKPAPDPLILALARLDTAAAHAAYLGDSPEDVQMARDAGTYVIGIPGGFPNRAELVAASPDFLADSLAVATRHLLGDTRGTPCAGCEHV